MGKRAPIMVASVLLLAGYEQSGKPLDEFLPTMLEHLPEYGR